VKRKYTKINVKYIISNTINIFTDIMLDFFILLIKNIIIKLYLEYFISLYTFLIIKFWYYYYMILVIYDLSLSFSFSLSLLPFFFRSLWEDSSYLGAQKIFHELISWMTSIHPNKPQVQTGEFKAQFPFYHHC